MQTFSHPGKFPESWRIPKLKPQHKRGSLTEPSNYRIISLLPLISTAIEKVIRNQGSMFLNQLLDLIYNYYSGFKQGYSTDFSRSFLNEKIFKGFEKGMYDDCYDIV